MKAGAAAIRAAIIDLDGTMLHTVPDFELALNGMRAEFGLAPITQQIIEPMVGKGSEKLIRDVLALDFDTDRIDAVFDEAMAAYQRHYLAINGERATLYPGVIEGLQALKDLGLRLACVTNKPIAFTLPLLAQERSHALLRAGVRRRLAAAQEARSPAAAAGLPRLRPGAGARGRDRRLQQRCRSGARGRLFRAHGAIWL
jgi:phosphoglycolate phosphatase-like HAD superfamily hydrolase